MSDEAKVQGEQAAPSARFEAIKKFFRDFYIIHRMRNSWDGENWWQFSFFLIFLVAAAMGLTCVACALMSDGRADYCYVSYSQSSPGKYVFMAHVPWRTDRLIADSKDIEQLDKTQCPVAEIR